ncbi:MAG TPA: hypothetical protein DEA55_06140 [Rhodospirillaceae bacterium]|nr:hypothetical protein [Rhodospirillaceae bacterium]
MAVDLSSLDQKLQDRLVHFAGIATTSIGEGERSNAIDMFLKALKKNGLTFQDFVKASLDPASRISDEALLDKIAELDGANEEWQKVATDLQAAVNSLKAENEKLKTTNEALKKTTRGPGSSGAASGLGQQFNAAASGFPDQTRQLAEAAKRIADLENELRDKNALLTASDKKYAALKADSETAAKNLAEMKTELTKARLKPNQILQAVQAACAQLEQGTDPSHFSGSNGASNVYGLSSQTKDALSVYFIKKAVQANFLDEVENIFHLAVAMSKAAGLEAEIKIRDIPPSHTNTGTPVRLIKVTTKSKTATSTISAAVSENVSVNYSSKKAICMNFNDDLFPESSYALEINYLSDGVFRYSTAYVKDKEKRVAKTFLNQKDIVNSVLPYTLEMIYGNDNQKIRPVFDMLKTTFDIQ